MKGNTIKLITLSLIAVAPYPGIATPPAEAYSVPAKAYPSKRTLNGQRRQQPPALR